MPRITVTKRRKLVYPKSLEPPSQKFREILTQWEIDNKKEVFLNQARTLAKSGDLFASYSYGSHALNRKKDTSKNSEAFKYLKLAADGGISDACYETAMCYLHGKGVQKSNVKAMEYFLLSHFLGSTGALNGILSALSSRKSFRFSESFCRLLGRLAERG